MMTRPIGMSLSQWMSPTALLRDQFVGLQLTEGTVHHDLVPLDAIIS